MKLLYATIGATLAAPLVFFATCIAATWVLFRKPLVDAEAFNYIPWSDDWTDWEEVD